MVFKELTGGSVVKNPPASAREVVRKIPEKGMAAHSSVLAWRIPWTEEPGGLQSMGSQRLRHDLGTKQQERADNSRHKDR